MEESRFNIQQKLLKDAMRLLMDYKNCCRCIGQKGGRCEICEDAERLLKQGKEVLQ